MKRNSFIYIRIHWKSGKIFQANEKPFSCNSFDIRVELSSPRLRRLIDLQKSLMQEKYYFSCLSNSHSMAFQVTCKLSMLRVSPTESVTHKSFPACLDYNKLFTFCPFFSFSFLIYKSHTLNDILLNAMWNKKRIRVFFKCQKLILFMMKMCHKHWKMRFRLKREYCH